MKSLQEFGNVNLFRYQQQQDAHEFFQLLSSLVGKVPKGPNEFYNNLTSDSGLNCIYYGKRINQVIPSTIRNPFTGLLASRLTCTNCQFAVLKLIDGLEK